jgi:hypothetical protein
MTPELEELLRRVFSPTAEGVAADAERRRIEEEEQRRAGEVSEEMGHADARWSRVIRRWAAKNTVATTPKEQP